MSGPKGIGIVVIALACPLAVGVIAVAGAVALGTGAVALAAKATSLAVYAVQQAKYRRLCEHRDGLIIQLYNLGIEKKITWITQDKLIEAEGIDIQKNKVETLIAELNAEIKNFTIKVQKRHRSLYDSTVMIKREWQRLEALTVADVPANWSEQDKSIINSLVADALRQSHPISLEPLTLDMEGVRRMDTAENLCNETIRIIKGVRSKIDEAINKAHLRQVSDRLTESRGQAVSLAEFMKTIVNHESDPEDKILDRLDSMLADVALLKDTAAWESLLRCVDDIRKETDHNIRKIKYESLVLECDGMLRSLRIHELWRTDVEALIDSTAPLKKDAKIAEIISELELILRTGRVIDLEDVRNRLEIASTNAKEAFGRDYRRRAVLDSLAAVGYEVEDGQMETALVSAGKIYLRKPGERDYAVEIVANNNFSTVQTAIVRFADSHETTQQQQLRDKETEDIWCEEHARLRSDLTAQGLESHFLFKISAGLKPVRVVLDSDRVRSCREAGVTSVPKQQIRTER